MMYRVCLSPCTLTLMSSKSLTRNEATKRFCSANRGFIRSSKFTTFMSGSTLHACIAACIKQYASTCGLSSVRKLRACYTKNLSFCVLPSLYSYFPSRRRAHYSSCSSSRVTLHREKTTQSHTTKAGESTPHRLQNRTFLNRENAVKVLVTVRLDRSPVTRHACYSKTKSLAKATLS